MRVGIIGAGEISGYHIDGLKSIEEVEIVGICDIDVAKAVSLGDKNQIKNVFTDFKEMILKVEPDVVHVLTPPKFHSEMAIDALKRGCHVVVEKPMALSVSDAELMVTAARSAGKRLCVCEMYHFDPVVQRARKEILKGTIGRIIYAESYWFTNLSDGSEAYTTRGGQSGWAYDLPDGVFGNFLEHPVYLQRELLGNVEEVSVFTKKIGNNPFIPYDELRVTLSGIDRIGYIVSSINGKPRLNSVRVYGTKGIINADISNMALTILKERNLPSFVSKGITNLEQSYQLAKETVSVSYSVVMKKIKARQGLHNLLKDYYANLSHGQDGIARNAVLLNPERALETVRIIEKIRGEIAKGLQIKNETKIRVRERVGSLCLKVGNVVKREGRLRVLVTGGNGFLARHLIEELLRRNYIVRVIMRYEKEKYEENLNMEVVYGDIRNGICVEKAMQGVDLVFHCAAITSNKGAWKLFKETNVDGTKKLLDAASQQCVKRFVFVSSVAVYGMERREKGKVVSEEDGYGMKFPRFSYYAKSKIEAEKIVLESYRECGLPVVIIRPGVIFGEGGKNSLEGKWIIFGAKNKMLPYIYVSNVIDALILVAMHDEAVGKIYNVVDDLHLTQGEFRDNVMRLNKNKQRNIYMPRVIMYFMAKVFEAMSRLLWKEAAPPFSVYHYKSIIRNLKYSNEKIKKELKWTPKVSVRHGIEKLCRNVDDEEKLMI
jgi:2-alkyl-3-oxoalkanoate reductase